MCTGTYSGRQVLPRFVDRGASLIAGRRRNGAGRRRAEHQHYFRWQRTVRVRHCRILMFAQLRAVSGTRMVPIKIGATMQQTVNTERNRDQPRLVEW